jgi:excinuclease ABC subunit C
VKRELLEAAARNAREEIARAETESERRSRTLEWLQRMLELDELPRRIEAYDISNTGSFGIVASMTVFEDGKPAKKNYRKFRMKTVTDGPDDYASMHEAVSRRIERFVEKDEKFMPLPDLLLIDGGAGQVSAAVSALAQRGFHLPVFGMVKDDRHRTRALTTQDGREIGIQANPAVFAFVGNIQEETHRFAIEYHRKLREKTITSQLEEIPGVGQKRRKALLDAFKNIKAIQGASVEQLSTVVPKSTAQAVYDHFHSGEEDT